MCASLFYVNVFFRPEHSKMCLSMGLLPLSCGYFPSPLPGEVGVTAYISPLLCLGEGRGEGVQVGIKLPQAALKLLPTCPE
jgi:hypothetical protein